MSIQLSENESRVRYTLAQSVSQSVFAVPFEFFEDADLTVFVDSVVKVEGADYTVSGGGGSTGNITFLVALVGSTGGSIIEIVRRIAVERTTDFLPGADINRAALNQQLDTLTAMIGDVNDKADRSIRISDSDFGLTDLPDNATRKGKVLAFNESTGNVEAGPTISGVNTVSQLSAQIQTLAEIEDGTVATGAITTAAGIASDIITVAAIDSDVVTVAGVASDIPAVAGLASDFAAVAAVLPAVSAVAAIDTDVVAVAANATDISAVAAIDSDVSTVAANVSDITNFSDVYLGPKSTNPLVRNDGSALQVGDLYFDIVNDIVKVFDGLSWVVSFVSGVLIAANNLSDVLDATEARENIEIYDFDDVATLLADTGSGFGAGSIWRTRSEGFSYEEAPTSAVDQHVTTAGGVKLYVLADAEGFVNLAAFGSLTGNVYDIWVRAFLSGYSILVPDLELVSNDTIIVPPSFTGKKVKPAGGRPRLIRTGTIDTYRSYFATTSDDTQDVSFEGFYFGTTDSFADDIRGGIRMHGGGVQASNMIGERIGQGIVYLSDGSIRTNVYCENFLTRHAGRCFSSAAGEVLASNIKLKNMRGEELLGHTVDISGGGGYVDGLHAFRCDRVAKTGASDDISDFVAENVTCEGCAWDAHVTLIGGTRDWVLDETFTASTGATGVIRRRNFTGSTVGVDVTSGSFGVGDVITGDISGEVAEVSNYDTTWHPDGMLYNTGPPPKSYTVRGYKVDKARNPPFSLPAKCLIDLSEFDFSNVVAPHVFRIGNTGAPGCPHGSVRGLRWRDCNTSSNSLQVIGQLDEQLLIDGVDCRNNTTARDISVSNTGTGRPILSNVTINASASTRNIRVQNARAFTGISWLITNPATRPFEVEASATNTMLAHIRYTGTPTISDTTSVSTDVAALV